MKFHCKIPGCTFTTTSRMGLVGHANKHSPKFKAYQDRIKAGKRVRTVSFVHAEAATAKLATVRPCDPLVHYCPRCGLDLEAIRQAIQETLGAKDQLASKLATRIRELTQES